MGHHDRHNNNRIFRSLSFVNGCCICQYYFIQFRGIILYRTVIKADYERSLCNIYAVNNADIAVENLLVIVVLDLHHFIAGTECISAATKFCRLFFMRIADRRIHGILKKLIQIHCADSPALHGRENLNSLRSDMIKLRQAVFYQVHNDLRCLLWFFRTLIKEIGSLTVG